MLRFLFLLIIILSSGFFNLEAQLHEPEFQFNPSPRIKQDSTVQMQIKNMLSADINRLDLYNGRVKKELEDIYRQRKDYFSEELNDGMFLLKSEEQAYCQKVLNTILKSNPSLRTDVSILYSRSTVPNAYANGDRFVVVHAGLVKLLENEAQLAFIICHELTHLNRDHVNRSIVARVEKANDKELNKSIKRVLNDEYGRVKKLNALLLPEIMETMRYKRGDEFEADSIGLILLSRTPYDLTAATRTMDILESINQRTFERNIDLRTFFTIPEVPARSVWYSYSVPAFSGFFAEEADSLSDSLATHPDCALRKESLDRQITKLNSQPGSFFVHSESDFQRLCLKAEGECIQTMIDNQNLSKAMYLSMLMLERYPRQVYPRALLSLGLCYYSYLQNLRETGYWITMPSTEYTEGYNRFVTFLQTLRPAESAGLGHHMINPLDESLKKQEAYHAACAVDAFITKQKESFNSLYTSYTEEFKTVGNFSVILDDLNAYYNSK